MSRSTLWWLAGAALAVVFIGFVFFRRSAPVPAPAPSVVATSVARIGQFDVRVRAQGRVGEPAGSQAKLSFALGGILQSNLVRVGQAVVAGEPLAQLDVSRLSLTVQQAAGSAQAASGGYGGNVAAVQSAEAKVTLARQALLRLTSGGALAQSDRATAQATLRQSQLRVEADRREVARQATLYAGGVAALKDVQAARSQLAVDEAEARAAQARALSASSGITTAVRQAEADYAQALADLQAAQGQAVRASAELGLAQRDLANGTLRSPRNGVIIAVLHHPGEFVDPSSPVVIVGPPISHTATLYVAGAFGRRVHVGDRAALTLPRSRESTRGTVIAVVPAVDPLTQQTMVVIGGVPPDALPGDAVDASIIVATERGVLLPTSALVEDPQTGSVVVFKQALGAVKFTQAQVRVKDGDAVTSLIASGVAPGDRVATDGAYDLLAAAGGA